MKLRPKSIYLSLAVWLVAMIFLLGQFQQRASALLSPVYHGYFTNIFANNLFGQVIDSCTGANPLNSSMTNKAKFINQILDFRAGNGLNGASCGSYDQDRNSVGGNFIIQTMRGVASPNGEAKAPTAAEITDWKNRINSSNIVIRYQNYTWTNYNSGYMGTAIPNSAQDDAFWSDSGTSASLVFIDNSTGKVVYVLKANCANPVGNLSGLPPGGGGGGPQDFTITPHAYPPVLNDEENPTEATFTSDVDANIGTDIKNVKTSRNYYIQHPVGTTALTVDPVSGAGPNPEAETITLKDIKTYPEKRVISGLLPGDQICHTITVDPKSGKVDSAGNVSSPGGSLTTTPVCASVVNKPYFRVYGNDVWAGGAFSKPTDVSCSSGPIGKDIKAFGKTNGAGAATQFAATALDLIDGFSSAAARIAAPTPPKGLTMANISGIGVDTWGGKFGTTHCVTDYFTTTQKKPPEVQVVDRSSNFTLNYAFPSPPFGAGPPYCNPLCDSGGSFKFGKQTLINMAAGTYLTFKSTDLLNNVKFIDTHHTLFVNGDLFIENDIVYDESFTNINRIPSFSFVVKGNIYISKDVRKLDGFYVAQPNDSGGGGTIYTCTEGIIPVPTSQLNAKCDNQLTVTGAFVANKVKLLRSSGSLRDSVPLEPPTDGSIAEVFNFSPEMYLARPVFQQLFTQDVADYNSIVSLPPLL